MSEYLDRYYRLKKYEIAGDFKAKSLPIEANVYSDTYLFYSSRLAILQSNELTKKVIDRYMLDIKLYYNKSYSNFLFFDEETENLLEINEIKYKNIEYGNKIIDFIKKYINSDFYVNIHLDEFFLKEKEVYCKRHFVHENLIYGYNDKESKFCAFGFGKKNKMVFFEIDYNEFLLAFEKGRIFYYFGADYLKLDNNYPLSIIKIKRDEKFEISWEFFIKKLRKFWLPSKNEIVENDIHVYGINVYDWIIEEMIGKTNRVTVDYRMFHLLHEHKKNIMRVMLLLNEKKKIDDNLFTEYERILKEFNELRLFYLKEVQKQNGKIGFNNRITNDTINKKIADKLIKAKNHEKIFLEIFFKNIKNI